MRLSEFTKPKADAVPLGVPSDATQTQRVGFTIYGRKWTAMSDEHE